MLLHKTYIWEKSCSRDIGQNALSQSDSRIFKSNIFPEQIDETASCFCMFIQIHNNSKLIKIFLVGHGQKWVWPIWSLDSKIDNLKNELMELTDFLGAGRISCKLKGIGTFGGGHGQKWAWPVWS